MVFVAVDCVVGEFRIDQRTAHVDKDPKCDRGDMTIEATVCIGSLYLCLREIALKIHFGLYC